MMRTEEQLLIINVTFLPLQKKKRAKITFFKNGCLFYRYGREDEELMGLRFCNEVVVAAEQIYPTPLDEEIKRKKSIKDKSTENSEKSSASDQSTLGPNTIENATDGETSKERSNSTLVNNQGFVAVPFIVDMGNTAPPSVRLVPCRPYSGAPIGKITFFK